MPSVVVEEVVENKWLTISIGWVDVGLMDFWELERCPSLIGN